MLGTSRESQILSKVQVAKPCPADWKHMQGDDRVRHCTHCSKNVYNISNMSRREAAELIQKNEGRLCVRYYTRADGGVMTKDCAKRLQKRLKVATLITTALSICGCGSMNGTVEKLLYGGGPLFGQTLTGDMAAPVPPITGKLAVPPRHTLGMIMPIRPSKTVPTKHVKPIKTKAKSPKKNG